MASDFIPYIYKPHPVTGVNNGKFGTWLFLASEVMLFGALFSTFILLRVGAEPGVWAESARELSVPWAFLNTVVLISSSVTIVMSWAALKLNNFKKYKVWMSLTVLLSFGFLVIKTIEYSGKFGHHIYPSTNTFFAIYFTMTGLHGLHVIGGIIVNLYLLIPGSKMWFNEPERFTGRIECAGLYWHFVDIVWIFLFPTLYLL